MDSCESEESLDAQRYRKIRALGLPMVALEWLERGSGRVRTVVSSEALDAFIDGIKVPRET